MLGLGGEAVSVQLEGVGLLDVGDFSEEFALVVVEDVVRDIK